MEITIDIHPDDIVFLKDQLSTSNVQITDTERRIISNMVDTKRCQVDNLPLVQRVMKDLNVQSERPFHIHEFLHRSNVKIPELVKPERNPVLEARCQRLRAEQSNREYKDMVRNVDSVTAKESPLSEIGREIRSINRHLITLFNMLFTVVGSFVFAYFGTMYVYPSGPWAFAGRLGAGLLTATVVFFADLYFVIRTLDDEAYQKKSN